jgi:translation initiation factor IF-3
VLSERGEMIGVLTLSEALQEARDVDQDLVLINEKAVPPIAKIIDLAKYKYQLQQKESESRKKSKAQDIKEVRFTPFMADGDFESRLRKVLQFLKTGDKVRLSLQFKGRVITKKEFGFDVFTRVINATQEYASVEMEPKLMGQKLIAQLMPIKTKVKDIKI